MGVGSALGGVHGRHVGGGRRRRCFSWAAVSVCVCVGGGGYV